jgi:hypothetical protein
VEAVLRELPLQSDALLRLGLGEEERCVHAGEASNGDSAPTDVLCRNFVTIAPQPSAAAPAGRSDV